MTQRRRLSPTAACLAIAVAAASTLVALAPPAAAQQENNTVSGFGDARSFGPAPGTSFAQPLEGIAPTPSGGGYWLVASDGGVFTFGDAQFHGSMGGQPLARPVVGMAARPSGNGYWLVASDGGVFTFGDAQFHGSMGGQPLVRPVVGMAATPSGNGYWLVASDGGVFTFGDAQFHGSMGGRPLAQPMVGMAATPSGNGYWLVASDGGVFTFGDAQFHGSEGGRAHDAAFVAIAADPDNDGYWLTDNRGQVFSFGVPNHGSATDSATGSEESTAATVDIAAHPGGGGYWLVHGGARIVEVEDRGPQVRALQERLQSLGYWVGPVDGVFGTLTEQAVYAFQKVNGLPIDGRVGPETAAALDRATRPQPRSGSGDLVEIDKSRQVLFIVRDGRVLWAFNTSTGTEEPYTFEGQRFLADTPPGRWEVFRRADGVEVSHLGRLYRPIYFHYDGIAVHGYSFVPPYPASHGCVRVTNPAIDFIWAENFMPIGSLVWVYGETPGA